MVVVYNYHLKERNHIDINKRKEKMAMLVADLFTDNVGLNILSFLDHKTEIEYKIRLVEDKLKNNDYDEELCYKLECLYNYLNDPTVWITGDMVDGEDCYYDSDCCYSDYSDYN